MSDTAIRLAFPVTADDQRRAARAMLEQQPVVRAIRIITLALPFVMIAWSMSAGWPFAIAVFRNLFWIVFATLQVLFFIPLCVRSLVKVMRKADPDWAGEQALLLDETGIHLLTPPLLLDVPWHEVQWAVEKQATFLFRLGGTRLLFIPVRAAVAQQTVEPLRRLLHTRLGPRARLAVAPAGTSAL